MWLPTRRWADSITATDADWQPDPRIAEPTLLVPLAQGQEPSAASGSKVPSANRTGGWATGSPRLPLGPDDGLAHRAGRYPSSDAWPR